VLRVENLCVARGGRTLLDSINVSFNPGELVALVGPNGAGKSTLLKSIAGEVTADTGHWRFGSQALKSWDRQALARSMAILPQHAGLSFDFLVEEIVELGRLPYQTDGNVAVDRAITATALERVGLLNFAKRQYLTLSGGEKQRAHFARTLAQICSVPGQLPGQGKLLLLDEPTSALDLAQQQALLKTAWQIARGGGIVLAVLHDLNLASVYADRIIMLKNGRVLVDGPPQSVICVQTILECYDCEVNLLQSRTGSPIVSLPYPAADSAD